MTYDEFTKECKRRNLTIKDALNSVGLSYVGIKTALENRTISMRHIMNICDLFRITPNEFFGYTNGLAYLSTQNDTDYCNLLKEQLKIKDEQIAKLIDLLHT